ncbi:phospholipase d1 [Ophiostoma piceae UAMH 11346]|uniref:Phospholipase D1 n=1 Tax=Ophiostoma piceae (strain UAMH 11346) TaxID=1262450 RepID=S3D4C0_OPHP1|nr:phospholipase d1 [Ophiostoma piceae UAMH 11346]
MSASTGPQISLSGAPPVPLKDKELPPIPELFYNTDGTKPNGNGSAPTAPTGNGSAVISKPEIRTPSSMTPPVHPRLAGEADDYLNGGLPHGAFQSPSIRSMSDSAPQSLPSPAGEAAHGGTAVSPLAQNAVEDGVESSPATPGPVRRRDVQFSQSDTVIEPPFASHERQGSWDNPSRSRQFMSRLKALAVQGGLPGPRTPSSSVHDLGAPLSTTSSPTMARRPQSTRSLNENDGGNEGENAAEADTDSDNDADADAEETADEAATDGGNRPKRRKRRMYRHRQTARSAIGGGASSPGASGFNTMPNSPLPSTRQMNFSLQRRSTMPEIADHPAGLSEGEGRDRLIRHGWRRGSSWVTRGDFQGDGEARAGRVSRHVRRSTVFGGGVSDGDAMALTPRRNFFPADRTMTYGVQKWRQMKNTLKAFRPKKEEFDYLKSAELMAELRAGAPAVLMLASMIQRDEHGNKRIPVLLEQLRLRIRDSTPVQEGDSERHWLFTIDLEYGSGPSRMKWTIKRTIGEIMEMHLKYKLTRNDKYLHTPQIGVRPKQPKFPISAFPYVRGLRGIKFDDEDEAGSIHSDDGNPPAPVSAPVSAPDGNMTAGEATAGEGTGTDAEGGRPNRQRKKSRIGGVLGMSRRSSGLAGMDGSAVAGDSVANALDEAAQRRKYVEKQQRMLEKYLNEMVHWLIFRADSNRLCRFLELSALGVRLAAEGSYHGKECFLHIQSIKGLDFRRVLTPGKVIDRHTRKWFLVRQSYIVCVESPENMNIYDVYLVDPKFLIISKNKRNKHQLTNGKLSETAAAAEMEISTSKNRLKHHTLTVLTSERKVKLWARNQHLIGQFEESICDMLKQTPWHRRNRFDSFAPVRTGVFAQWLVDGRDYMWNVSRAIAMAKDVIYIHDWWLSPELYMRRPACISQKWRLDRLLQRKAQEGVKIFVIIYRNVEAAIPIDSEYTKFSLLNLHPNIFVQRSPNQFKKNQFFFAHHEKICVVDHDVAFVGGIDLCFGRWDSPQHTLVDDKPTGFEMDEMVVPKDADHTQLWPGKDYSNPRVQDFFSLREPYKEMYDRTKVPRMPWHDVGMQIVGQPARDLTRHFVQRWNYVRRGRKPTRPTPFLLPPPDYRQEDLENLGLSGTCEVQILRSASAWSLGITDVECSIQTAYISMIEESDHFVYMENQFFITSTETLNVKIINRIGDALVERIIRAHRNEEDWRAVIIIPLMPGFQSSVADQEGTSVRLILQCQYRSICRGENSIFGRLRTAGIEPEEYIQFFSLRQWGKINNKTVLTTEQLYIHAKAIIVDDRVALIGSANINERSLLGDRDSETAAIVRDTDMISSSMAGRPYMVGRFAHTLRLRLMQEHLGLDTDEIMEDARKDAEFEAEMDELYSEAEGGDAGHTSDDPSSAQSDTAAGAAKRPSVSVDAPADLHPAESSRSPYPKIGRTSSYNHDVDLQEYGSDDMSPERSALDAASVAEIENKSRDVEGHGEDHWTKTKNKGTDKLRDTSVVDGHEVLITTSFEGSRDAELFLSIPKDQNGHRPGTSNTSAPSSPVGTSHDVLPPQPSPKEVPTSPVGVLPPLPVTDDTDIGGPSDRPVNPLAADIRLARITKDCMRDPLDPTFYDDVWNRAAENNTKIYRRVFRCLPDSEATNWHEFQEFIAYGARFQESMETRKKGDEADRSESTNANQQPHNHARHGAGGGAGISVPSPAGLAAVSTVGEKVSNAVFNFHNRENQNNDNENEKRSGSAGNDSFGRPATKESYPSETEMGPCMDSEAISKVEMERAAAAENAFKRRPESASGRSCGHEGSSTVPPLTSEFLEKPDAKAFNGKGKNRRTTFSEQEKPPRPSEKDVAGTDANANTNAHGLPNLTTTTTGATTATSTATAQGSVKKRRRATTRGSRRGLQGNTDEILSKADAEELCNMIQGHIVQFPYDWLLTEEGNGNWLYQVDQVAPLQIYN